MTAAKLPLTSMVRGSVRANASQILIASTADALSHVATAVLIVAGVRNAQATATNQEATNSCSGAPHTETFSFHSHVFSNRRGGRNPAAAATDATVPASDATAPMPAPTGTNVVILMNRSSRRWVAGPTRNLSREHVATDVFDSRQCLDHGVGSALTVEH